MQTVVVIQDIDKPLPRLILACAISDWIADTERRTADAEGRLTISPA